MKKSDMAVQQVDLPYTVFYSSQFTMGKPMQSKIVLDLYQAYDATDFSKADEVYGSTFSKVHITQLSSKTSQTCIMLTSGWSEIGAGES